MQAHARTLVAGLLFFVSCGAQASFMFVEESAIFDPTSGLVNFSITFNQTPDFTTVDSIGRVANAFQYYIIGDPSKHYPATYDSIIRGEELKFDTSMLRIRNVQPTDPTVPVKVSGGWGTLRDVVPVVLEDTTLSFSVPLSSISDHSTDGNFVYEILVGEYGGANQLVTSRSSVPEPSGLALMVGALGLCFGFARRGHGCH